MKFGLFTYCTVGRREELERGMAGRDPDLYARMLEEIRYELNIDRLHAAAIERGARARHMV